MYNIDNYVCTGLICANMYDEQSLLLVKEITVEHHID